MEQENDYIKREIQKLTLALMKLIDKTVSAEINNFENVVFETNEKLDEYFGLSLNEFANNEDSELIEKLKTFHQVHLEKLIELLYQTIQKSEAFDYKMNFEIYELSKKVLMLIDYADDKSNSFSVERMNMKTQLIKNSNSN